MCTVTYIPRGKNQFILTSNRDENHSRNTSLLETRLLGTQPVSFPVDPISGGSWIAISQSNRVACILNAASTISLAMEFSCMATSGGKWGKGLGISPRRQGVIAKHLISLPIAFPPFLRS